MEAVLGSLLPLAVPMLSAALLSGFTGEETQKGGGVSRGFCSLGATLGRVGEEPVLGDLPPDWELAIRALSGCSSPEMLTQCLNPKIGFSDPSRSSWSLMRVFEYGERVW